MSYPVGDDPRMDIVDRIGCWVLHHIESARPVAAGISLVDSE